MDTNRTEVLPLKTEVLQMLNNLRIAGLRVGVILNFKPHKTEWERIAL